MNTVASHGPRTVSRWVLIAAFGTLAVQGQGQGETSAVARLPDMVVTEPAGGLAPPAGAPLNTWSTGVTARDRLGAQDAAGLLADVPGAAVVRNGPQTGIVQLRGLSGDRVRVRVDGRTLSPACPNHMDPPLHYAAPSAMAALQVAPGITPVSLGGDSLGGVVLAPSPPPRFSTNGSSLVHGEVGAEYRSANDGYGGHGSAGVAGAQSAVSYGGSWQTAEDLRIPGGRVRDTGYDSQLHRVEAAARTPSGVCSVDANLLRTRDAGTPALPMDMIEDDGVGIGVKHAGDYDWGGLAVRAYHHAIDHEMDNHSLRPLAPGMMGMRSPAESDDTGATVDLSRPADTHTLRTGIELHRNTFDAYQEQVASGARQDTLNDAARARAGAYTEWQADWQESWSTLIGVRSDVVNSDANAIEDFYATGAKDAARFNAGDRDQTDVAVDATATLRFTPDAHSTYELGVARKTRSPSLLERYLWTPLSASAGQADGRTYLGDLGLDPETSHQIVATADWHGPRWQLQVSPFYHVVADYIQGMPTDRVDAMQRPVLQYSNLDEAELYGADGLARCRLSDHLRAGATVSYVRGRTPDTGDNLYRLAPLRGTVDLEHQFGRWVNQAQVKLVDDQRDVARYNGEMPTDGYTLLNVRTGYRWRQGAEVWLGVENVFDETYADHLNGINRVSGSDVPVGDRIPGAARSLVAAATCPF